MTDEFTRYTRGEVIKKKTPQEWGKIMIPMIREIIFLWNNGCMEQNSAF